MEVPFPLYFLFHGLESGMFPDIFSDDVLRIETPRLWLRWPRATDAKAIAELATDPDLARLTARVPHPFQPGAAAEFILTSRSDNVKANSLTLVLVPKRHGADPIGCISLRPREEGKLSLGFWLGKPYWGRGLMTEAVRELIDLTFRMTDVQDLQTYALFGNQSARRVLEKCGFQACGQSIATRPARSDPAEVESFRLTREAWMSRGFVRAPFPLAPRHEQGADLSLKI
ncbi:MAG: N-acetyltransferase [Alphaproteobacteria bacterium]|nr:N-acetyltransferase [Alphaproteobacteria bacterium]